MPRVLTFTWNTASEKILTINHLAICEMSIVNVCMYVKSSNLHMEHHEF